MAITRVVNQIVNKGGTLYHVEQYRDSETGQVFDNEDAVGQAPDGLPEGPVAEDNGAGVLQTPTQPNPPDMGGGTATSVPVDRSQASDAGNLGYPGLNGFGAMAGYGGLGGLGSIAGGNEAATGAPFSSPYSGASRGSPFGGGFAGGYPQNNAGGFQVPGYASPFAQPNYQGSPFGAPNPQGRSQMSTPMTGLGNQPMQTGAAGQAQRFAAQNANVTPGAPGTDMGALRNSFLYNWDNPVNALDQAMRDNGVNPFKAGNPFVQMIRSAAPGLALAFQMGHANDSPEAANGLLTGGGFGDYLRGALSGGNVFSSLQGAANSLPSLVRSLASNYDQNPMGMNSVAAGLLGLLEANAGQGTTGALFQLLSPMMTGSQRSGYQEQLRSGLETAQRSFANQPSLTNDIWQFLLGQ